MLLSDLLLKAATVIDENAEALRECHTVNGKWPEEDLHVLAEYERDKRLVSDLRDASHEMLQAEHLARSATRRSVA